jgi:hypothetical protein
MLMVICDGPKPDPVSQIRGRTIRYALNTENIDYIDERDEELAVYFKGRESCIIIRGKLESFIAACNGIEVGHAK